MIIGILFLLAVAYAGKEGLLSAGKAAGTARTSARQKATARGGSTNRDAIARRAARQATTGFWAGEFRHGFPAIRHGFRTGWDEHLDVMRELEMEREKRQADHAERHQTWRDQIDEYRRRREHIVASGTQDPPLADGRTPGRPPGGGCRDHGCQCHEMVAADPGSGKMTVPGLQQAIRDRVNGRSNGNGAGPMADINYDQALEITNKLTAAAEQGVNDEAMKQAVTLADELGAMVPGDSTTQGLAADVVSAAQKVIEAHQELADAAPALHARIEDTYGPVKEAKEASGEALPQPEFVEA